MSIKHILTFTREPIDCDIAESICLVHKPCNQCNEYFNSLPIVERARVEIPRRIGLANKYGWRAGIRGVATDKEFRGVR